MDGQGAAVTALAAALAGLSWLADFLKAHDVGIAAIVVYFIVTNKLDAIQKRMDSIDIAIKQQSERDYWRGRE